MHKNRLTIIVYLLIILVAAFPAINAIGERLVYAQAPAQNPVSIKEPEPFAPITSQTPDAVAQVQVQAPPTANATATPTTGAGAPAVATVTETEAAPSAPELTEQREPSNTGVIPEDPAELATPTYAEDTLDAENEDISADETPQPTRTPIPTQAYTGPPSSEWKQWPVLPESLSPELIEIYRQGIEDGNNVHAFSVLGDCQSIPDVFMGLYDQDPSFVADLPQNLQETVRHFGGSFERYSPTVKDGTTEGALLWYGWNDNLAGLCEHGESPLDCELRVHKPTIVFLHTGTHWEARSRDYLIKIINKIKEANAIPVIVTKADNRELDGRVNQTLADLAAEYNLPMWNFWSSVQHLPENGMEPGSDMYLSEAGLEVHRLGALEALDKIWRMAEGAP